MLDLYQCDTFILILYSHTNIHMGRDAQTYPKLDTDSTRADELEMDLFTSSVFSQVTTVIWPGFSVMYVCVCAGVCVCECALSLRTGGGQQGREQASEQVECH